MKHTAARGANVWQRLTADTAARQALPARQRTFTEGSTAQSSTPLGWSQGLSLTEVKQASDSSGVMEGPVDPAHKARLNKSRRDHPVEFFCAIRPHCKTTTQTMRCALTACMHRADLC